MEEDEERNIYHPTRSAVIRLSALPGSIENKLFGSCLTMFDSSTVGELPMETLLADFRSSL